MTLQCLHVSIGTANRVTRSCAVVAILSWYCNCLFSSLSIPRWWWVIHSSPLVTVLLRTIVTRQISPAATFS